MRRAGGVLLAVVLVALAACGSPTTAAESSDEPVGPPTEGGSLAVGVAAGIAGWTPADNQWTPGALMMARAVYDPLAAFADDGTAVPYLAQAIEANDDATEWTITLRPGVTFHNGDPLDADAVVANLEAVHASPLLESAAGPIESVRATSDLEVVVTMDEPWTVFPLMMALQPGFIVHPDLIDGVTDEPIGTGPFVLEDWRPDDRLTAVANPDYWRPGLPRLDRVEFTVMVDDTSRKDALLAGDLDVIQTPDPSELAAVLDGTGPGDGIEAIRSDGADDVLFALLNSQSGPTADHDVRRALQLATDRDRLNEQLFNGVFTVVDGPTLPDSRWWSDSGWPEPDPESAAAMIAEWEDEHGDLEITLTTLPVGHLVRTAQYLETVWEEVGADVTIDTADEARFVLDLVTGNYEAAVVTLFNAPDPSADANFLHPDNLAAPGEFGLALSRLDSAELGDALDRAASTTDEDVRRAAFGEAWRTLADEASFLWLVESPWIVEAADHVHGLDTMTLPDRDDPPLVLNWGSMTLAEAWLEQ